MAITLKMDLGVVAEWDQRDGLEIVAMYQEGAEGVGTTILPCYTWSSG